MKIAVLSVVLFAGLSAMAQSKSLHYDSMRLQAPFNVCLVLNDSATINSYYQTLLNMDTSRILTGLEWYFYDLGANRYKAYMYLKDSTALNTSIHCMERCYSLNNEMTLVLWNLGLYYYFKGDCTQSLYYLNLYMSKVKIRRDEKKQIKNIKNSKQCKK